MFALKFALLALGIAVTALTANSPRSHALPASLAEPAAAHSAP